VVDVELLEVVLDDDVELSSVTFVRAVELQPARSAAAATTTMTIRQSRMIPPVPVHLPSLDPRRRLTGGDALGLYWALDGWRMTTEARWQAGR
jgi:hypothetical protein